METQRRGKNVAIVGAVAQAAFTLVMLILWRWSDSLSAMSCVWLLAGGAGIWLMVALLFYCGQRAAQEQIELDQIAVDKSGAGTIFQGQDDAQVRPAANRLAWMERWVVPGFTLLLAAYHVLIGILVLRYLALAEPAEPGSPAPAMLFSVLIAFVGFLFGRYAIGMARVEEWHLLRAPGSYLLACVLAVAAVAVAMLFGLKGYLRVDWAVAFVLPGVQLVLAAELLVNLVLDLYRPRIRGQVRRASFDSRLLNLLAEPGRVGHSIAAALNYQFGFEVSTTWFYKLLSRAFVPLLLFGVAAMFAMSGIVVVREGEQCVVTHWGKWDSQQGVLGAGVHLKWPWPIDKARYFDVARVREVLVGAGKARSLADRRGEFIKGREVYLWTAAHGAHKELDFLIAVSPKERDPTADPAAEKSDVPPVRIIKLVASVQYVIEDVVKFGYKYVDAEAMLMHAAYREMTRYCASATLTRPVGQGGPDRPEAIMTYGHARAARKLKKRIQAAVGPDGMDLGVKLTYVGFVAIHPPAEAAGAYEAVLEAERGVDKKRHEAQADANRMLIEAAGDVKTAWELAMALQALQDLRGLQTARPDRAEFDQALKNYIRSADQNIRTLDRQIEREVLLGKLGRGEQAESMRMILRAHHVAHLNRLRKIEADRAGARPVDLPGLVAAAEERAAEVFRRTRGVPAAEVARAEADRWQKELAERALAESFQREVVAYRASPRLYMLDRRLEVWEEILPGMTKHVLAIDPDKVQQWLNWEQKEQHMQDVFESPAEPGK